MLEFRFTSPGKIIELPHFIKEMPKDSNEQNNYTDDYILYFGRLSQEKGVMTLLKAIKNLKNLKLKIAGTGLQEDKLKEYVKNNNINNVEFLGFLSGDKLKQAIFNSLFTVMPSVAYETFGLSILESFEHKKPVIASDLGALPELVKNGRYGVVFKSGNAEDLAQKIKQMYSEKEKATQMGREAFDNLKKFNSSDYYQKILSIYNKAIENKE
jgi:glycosyltransferase involved in cell wall biosynthesis